MRVYLDGYVLATSGSNGKSVSNLNVTVAVVELFKAAADKVHVDAALEQVLAEEVGSNQGDGVGDLPLPLVPPVRHPGVLSEPQVRYSREGQPLQ